MKKISWAERMKNEKVPRRIGEKRILISTIYNQQKKWTCPSMIYQRLLRDVTEMRLIDKKGGGRKRMMLLNHWRKEKRAEQKHMERSNAGLKIGMNGMCGAEPFIELKLTAKELKRNKNFPLPISLAHDL